MSLNRRSGNDRVKWRRITNGHKFDDDDLIENDKMERINGIASRITTVGKILRVFRVCFKKFDAMQQ